MCEICWGSAGPAVGREGHKTSLCGVNWVYCHPALAECVTTHHLPWKFPHRLRLDAQVPPALPTSEVSDIIGLEAGCEEGAV